MWILPSVAQLLKNRLTRKMKVENTGKWMIFKIDSLFWSSIKCLLLYKKNDINYIYFSIWSVNVARVNREYIQYLSVIRAPLIDGLHGVNRPSASTSAFVITYVRKKPAHSIIREENRKSIFQFSHLKRRKYMTNSLILKHFFLHCRHWPLNVEKCSGIWNRKSYYKLRTVYRLLWVYLMPIHFKLRKRIIRGWGR